MEKMNSIQFSKFHGLGNHFILVDNREGRYNLGDHDLAKAMYDVKIGIGADCLLEIRNCGHDAHERCAFELVNYGWNGSVDTFCGNGSRCAVKFACILGIVQKDEEFTFCGSDGEHSGFYDSKADLIHVGMLDVDVITRYCADNYFVFAGSPAHVVYMNAVKDLDVSILGEKISRGYIDGTNVMFVEAEDCSGAIDMRSYERGVKTETLACGTGAVAAALVNSVRQTDFKEQCTILVDVTVRLGTIRVKATRVADCKFKDVYLIGPASHVFDGVYFLKN